MIKVPRAIVVALNEHPMQQRIFLTKLKLPNASPRFVRLYAHALSHYKDSVKNLQGF